MSPGHHEGNNSPYNDDQPPKRTVNGLPFPEKKRSIDEHGYECTKHALRFRGDDWDIVLNNKRDELTPAFTSEAATATGEPEGNIRNIRYFLDEKHRLLVKFDVRHRAQTPSSVVQDRLATYPYKAVMALYEPRSKKPRPHGYQTRQTTTSSSFVFNRRPHPCVSSYGHCAADVGPNGPEFRDEREEEEPVEIEPEQRPLPVVLPYA
ncbi:uncharacterized protein TM35_000021820 [Trypanosoma theileri]|uniref:Flagellar attachment zone protein 1 conserved domain-containing protein n=1 Tax=Trypanosoma theileri TaxID=67003 RepID=A0A1X0P7C9_9TRYP|nr:uncharacterized protein TM35_000021820 [Trypanosoma theileri]ORC92856.1 hypothetical protein TM35_000021820 [Trypanosoma theileri]